MYFDVTALFYGAVFVATLLLIEGAYYLIRDIKDGPQKAMNRRMRMIAAGRDTRSTLRKLRRESKDPLSRIIIAMFPSVDQLLLHAGMTMSSGRLLALMTVAWAVVFSMLRIVTPMPPYIAMPVAAIVGFGLPLLYLLHQRSTRLKRFGEQMPDALDLIVRGLRAGHPVSSALSLVAKEMPDPIGSEFGIVVDEMTYGLDLSEALSNLATRVPHEDLRYLVVTIQIQYMVGGNLAEVLANLSEVIRDRYQMFAKIRAVTAEGRASAVIIGVLPLVFSAVILLIAPQFFTRVNHDPLFWPLLGAGGVLMIIGQIVLYRMVNFKV